MVTPVLEHLVHFEAIASALKLQVIDGVVKTCRCPVCRGGVMSIHRDHGTEGWRWFCRQCRWAGTSLQLYQEARKLPTLRAAWFEFCQVADLRLSEVNQDQQLINLQALVNRDQGLLELLADSKRYLAYDAPAAAIQQLEASGLWSGATEADFLADVGRFIGSVKYRQFVQLADYFDAAGLAGTLRRRDALVMSYESIPGYCSRLHLWDTKGARCSRSILDRPVDGGLLGLSEAMASTDRQVFAVLDPVLFLRLHRRWHANSTATLSLIAAASPARGVDNAITAQAWSALPHERVVLWDYGRSYEVINYARQLGDRGYVATTPHMDLTPEADVLAAGSAQRLVAGWSSSARHWPEALRDWLLALTVPAQRLLLSRMYPTLSDSEMDAVYATCDDAQRARIAAGMPSSNSVRSFQYGRVTILDRPGRGWYAVRATPGQEEEPEELVSEATVRMEEATSIGDETHICGTVSFSGRQLEFIEEESRLRDDLAKWLTNKCTAAAGFPVISSKYRDRLYDIALASHRPVTRATVARVGWDQASSSWKFPTFNIEGGTLVSTAGQAARVQKVPGARIKGQSVFPRREELKSWLEDTPVNRSIWAVWIAILSNLISAPPAVRPHGILLLGAGDFNERLVEFFGSTLTLTAFSSLGIRSRDFAYDRVTAAERQHGFPAVVRLNMPLDDRCLAWASGSEMHNCLMQVDHAAAVNLSMAAPWYLVRPAGGVDINPDMESFFDSLPAFLIWHGANAIDTRQVLPHLFTIDRLKQFLLTGHPAADVSLLDTVGASHLFYTAVDRWRSLLWSVFLCIKNGTLPLPAGGDVKHKGLYCDMDSNLHVEWKRLASVLAAAGLHLPDFVIIDEALRRSGNVVTMTKDGWCIPREAWEPEFKRWERVFFGG